MNTDLTVLSLRRALAAITGLSEDDGGLVEFASQLHAVYALKLEQTEVRMLPLFAEQLRCGHGRMELVIVGGRLDHVSYGTLVKQNI